MDDKKFENAFNSAGAWFILNQIEEFLDWDEGDKSTLIKNMHAKGFDDEVIGTRTRVNAILRLIKNGWVKRALEKIQTSEKINRMHPEARMLAEDIIKRRF
ncbi:hypothetical protein PMW03_11310 [Clostridium paraputrificum]|uniref:hypothetical protein n=1 Tax=Clostridium paraputrificum TaxID=29363 RepID=UPI00189C5058|nr:hypothetical protein [Clostridium paraputrificum]MDB2110732.1 hypothetical protein [Clostridium paraputrificum]